MHIIIFDSNFLLLPAQVKINIYDELERLFLGDYKILIYTALFQELERKLASLPVQNKLHREYRLSRALLEKYPHEINEKIPQNKHYVDEFLLDEALNLSKENPFVYLATNDKELRIKCENRKVATLFLRNGNKIEIR